MMTADTTGSDEDVSETSDFLQPFSALLKRPMSNRPILAKRPILKTSYFLQQAPGGKPNIKWVGRYCLVRDGRQILWVKTLKGAKLL